MGYRLHKASDSENKSQPTKGQQPRLPEWRWGFPPMAPQHHWLVTASLRSSPLLAVPARTQHVTAVSWVDPRTPGFISRFFSFCRYLWRLSVWEGLCPGVTICKLQRLHRYPENRTKCSLGDETDKDKRQ